MSELALRLIEENKKTRATFLDLGNCGLSEVPGEIGELVWLEGLSFSSAWRDENRRLRQSQNSGPANRIARLIPTSSTAARIGQRPVKPSQENPFSNLAALKRLYLVGESQEFWPLTDLSALAALPNLRILIVSKSQVTDLSPLVALTSLTHLGVGRTPVTDLTPLAGLVNLSTLFAHESPVANLAPLSALANLQSLHARGSQVADLAPVAGLVNLQTLNVSRTRVASLAPLAGLVNLQRLDIAQTLVTDLSPVLPLIEQRLPVQTRRESRKRGFICVEDCPLVHPPVEIAQQGNAAILRYFAERRRAGTIKVREAKLLLVGQGKAGKTTLRRKLEDPNAPLPEPGDTTRGIEITRLDEKMPPTGEPLRINVWDFGGQDIQHYAHQFFLTGSSLYALVTNERIQDAVHLPYWLNIVEMLGKKSPVLLIQNKDGGHCQPLRDEAAIRARFGNVHNRVFQTDLSKALTETEFADLRREIVHQASQLPHVEREYLASFAELRGKLEALADREAHYLRWDDYLALMPELSEDLLRDYAKALTFLGVCQYFPDDAMLSEFVFLRPKWIIDALFALLLHPSLEEKRGHFTEQDTRAIWQGPEYRGMHALLVRMMEEFELCYRVEGGSRSYILPQRLPGENQTYGWDEPGDTPVQYRYKFMPKGLLTRLICRLHPRIERDPARGQRVWCDAVIFALPDGKGRVFAREVYSENTIELRAAGDKREEMLNEVIRKMDDINTDAKYDNLQVDKLVPCPCPKCMAPGVEKRHFFKFDALKTRLENEGRFVICDESGRDVMIDEIFGKSGVERPHLRGLDLPGEVSMPRPLRIFISYAHAQRDYFPIFKRDFEQYARLPGLEIEVFGDDAIPVGTAWDDYLQSKVAGCDAMVLLVSQEFMNSEYIREQEFGAALARLRRGTNLLIAPIYFAPCGFESDEELSRLQFFKPHGDDFGEAQKGNGFSYIDLVKFRQTDGQPIPNANRQHYMKALMKKLAPELRGLAGG